MIRKIWTYGCSVSACYRPKCNDKSLVYSKLLADKLGAEDKNFSIGCGSNDRSFRLFTNHIQSNLITPSDIVLFQYTTPERREFWSKLYSKHYLREKYLDGQTFRYLPNMYGNNKVENEFSKLYENNFINLEYNVEILKAYHTSIQALADIKNITIIFLEAYTIFFNSYSKEKISKLKYGGYLKKVNNLLNSPNFHSIEIYDLFQDENNLYDKSETGGILDDGHFSPTGHKVVSQRIYDYIIDNKLYD
tara:strand:+ start:1 stop:744 length:744 start_codon:yes stop_codon:yes gene_type:complete